MKPILKISLFLYVALLLTPGALKSAHIFADHQHFFCDHSADSHFHQKNVECDLFSVHQHIFPGLDLFSYKLIVPEEFAFTPSYFNSIIYDRACTTISLRGPPTVS